MIILRKRRIVTIVGIICLILLVISVNSKVSRQKSVPTVTLPVSNKVIVLDAGHGKPDEGAESSNGTTEAETNLKIA